MSLGARFQGKVAVLSGSTQGIGLETARRLAQEGAKVVVSSRGQDNVDKAVAELRSEGHDVVGVVCHVANPEHRTRLLQTAVDNYGGVDVLIPCAGVNPHFGPMFDITEDQWDKTFEVNVKATFFLVKEAVPLMAKRGGGSIVLMSTVAVFISPRSVMAAYNVAKTAVVGLTKALNQPCSQHNIRVNCVAPGMIKTNFATKLFENKTMNSRILQASSLGREGTAKECASTIAFLASDDASYVTGETLVVGGGVPSRL